MPTYSKVLTMQTLNLSDVLMHAGIGTVFAGTGACLRGVCAHTHAEHYRILTWIVAAILIMIEATIMVAVVG